MAALSSALPTEGAEGRGEVCPGATEGSSAGPWRHEGRWARWRGVQTCPHPHPRPHSECLWWGLIPLPGTKAKTTGTVSRLISGQGSLPEERGVHALLFARPSRESSHMRVPSSPGQ